MTDRDLASGVPPGTRDDDTRQIELSLADPDCFGVLFDRYFAEIHGYAARRIGRDAADDVAAETFLTAFRSRRRFDAGRAVRVAASAFQSDRFAARQVLEGAIVGPPKAARDR